MSETQPQEGATQTAAARLAAYEEVVKAAMEAEPRRGAPPCALAGPAQAALFPSAAERILGMLCRAANRSEEGEKSAPKKG